MKQRKTFAARISTFLNALKQLLELRVRILLLGKHDADVLGELVELLLRTTRSLYNGTSASAERQSGRRTTGTTRTTTGTAIRRTTWRRRATTVIGSVCIRARGCGRSAETARIASGTSSRIGCNLRTTSWRCLCLRLLLWWLLLLRRCLLSTVACRGLDRGAGGGGAG